MGVHLVPHLHRFDDADHPAGFDLVAQRDLDREHGALHRRDDSVLACAARASGAPALAAPPRELGPRRLGLEQPHLEASPVQLDGANPRSSPPAPSALYQVVTWNYAARGAAAELGRACGELLRLDA